MHGHKNISFKIAFTGIMFGLVLLFQILEKFMPFGDTYIKLNFSLVFIMATIYVVGLRWGLILLILRFALGPAVSTLGYSAPGLWAQFILLCFGIIYIASFVSTEILLRNLGKFKNHYTHIIITALVALLLTSTMGAIINALLFTPVYWWVYHWADGSLSSAINTYHNNGFLHLFYFGISSYWPAMMAVYVGANLVKYSLISFVFIFLWKVIKHYISPKYNLTK